MKVSRSRDAYGVGVPTNAGDAFHAGLNSPRVLDPKTVRLLNVTTEYSTKRTKLSNDTWKVHLGSDVCGCYGDNELGHMGKVVLRGRKVKAKC